MQAAQQDAANSGSNKASFKQQRQRKTRTSLTQKLALSNQLKNLIESNKILDEVVPTNTNTNNVDKW